MTNIAYIISGEDLMVHAKKKQLVNYLFLTLGLYFLFQTTAGSDLQDFDIINNTQP